MKYSQNRYYVLKLRVKNVLIVFNKKYQTCFKKKKTNPEILLYAINVLKWYALPSCIGLLQSICMPAYVYIFYLCSCYNTGVMMRKWIQRG